MNADGQKYVFEGAEFSSKEACIYHTSENINKLTIGLMSRLNTIYGEGTWTPLEIGCVDKNGNPNKRVPILKEDWKIEDGKIILKNKNKGVDA
jgi:NADPH-dependent 7-cyano-7-deazaguanine reductase QueF-like protein